MNQDGLTPEIQKVYFKRIKGFIGRILFGHLMGKIIGSFFKDRIPSRGLRIYTKEFVSPEVKAQLFWGGYESAEIRFVKQYLRTDLDVVELGSSIGVVTSHIARRVVGKKIVCVEANPSLIDILHENLEINASDEKVYVVNAAIDYCFDDKEATVFSIGHTNLVSQLDLKTEDRIEQREVKITTLSSLVQEHGIGDYALVMDIEGAEIGIIMQDRKAMSSCQQLIAELHATVYHGKIIIVDDMIEIICKECGFDLIVRRGPVCVFERLSD